MAFLSFQGQILRIEHQLIFNLITTFYFCNKVFKETSNVDISLADSGYYEKCSSEMETSEVLDTIDTSSDDAVIDSEVVEGTQLNKT